MDLDDMRRRAAEQSKYGNYWAGKCLALIDQNLKLTKRVAELELDTVSRSEYDRMRRVADEAHAKYMKLAVEKESK